MCQTQSDKTTVAQSLLPKETNSSSFKRPLDLAATSNSGQAARNHIFSQANRTKAPATALTEKDRRKDEAVLEKRGKTRGGRHAELISDNSQLYKDGEEAKRRR